MKLLVTGGCGFVGSHLVDAPLSAGFTVRVVDNLSSGQLENVDFARENSRFELIVGDLKVSSVADRAVEDIGLVFHLAANPDVKLGAIQPNVHFDENLKVTFYLLEALRKTGGEERVVFASTSTVYGEATFFRLPKIMGLCFRSVCTELLSLAVRG